MLELHRRGWSHERIARHLQCSAHTVARHVVLGGWRPRAGPASRLAGLGSWLKKRLEANSGNADVVRQELAEEKGIVVGLRTVRRAVRGFRRELRAGERATVRFETAPGYQMLIVDELGYLPMPASAAHLLFQLVSRRYERGSMLVTSNQPVSEWGAVLGDDVAATAILDRLPHHSQVLTIRGESYRLREKRRSGLYLGAKALQEPSRSKRSA